MYEDWSPVEDAKIREGGQGTVTKVRHRVEDSALARNYIRISWIR